MGDKQLFVESSDSVIISDLLYFIWNKLQSSPATTVVTICHQFYTDEEYVFDEKQKLFNAINEHCNARRTEDKRQKNLEDICALLSRRDSRKEFLPKFASINLHNIPICDDGNPSLGQIMATLNDLKRKVVTTDMLSASFNNFRRELTSVSSASLTTATTSCPPSAPIIPLSPSAPPLPGSPTAPSVDISALNVPSSLPSFSDVTAAASRQPPNVPPPPGNGGNTANPNRARTSSKNRQKSQRKRDSSRPQIIIGKSVNDGLLSIKGADMTVNRYVGRFHNDATLDGVKAYIAAQKVTVVELEELDTKHGRFKSFRLRVKKTDLPLIQDENFWPEGVILSPFFRGKTISNNATGGPPQNLTSSNG